MYGCTCRKTSTVKQLDDEILDMMDESEIENEIEQPDTIKEKVRGLMQQM